MSSKAKSLSSEEKLALREKAKSELKRLEVVYAEDETKEKIHTFKVANVTSESQILLKGTRTNMEFLSA